MTMINRTETMHPLREVRQTVRTSPVFAFYVLVTLVYAGFIGLMVGQMTVDVDVYLPGAFGQMQHGAAESHRVHDYTFAFLVATGVVGILAQLRRPSKNVASALMALVPFGGLLLAAVLADDYTAVVRRNPAQYAAAVSFVAVLLHPSGRHFFRSFSVSRVNWLMLALVGVATVPLLTFASTQIRLQETVSDDHAMSGHYGFMAAFSFTVIGVGLLASLRPDGWRITAWVAGLLPALVGVLSVLDPDVASSLGQGWAYAAIAWGAVFIAVAEITRDTAGLPPGSRAAHSGAAPSESVPSQ
jgi:hypothetical protein